MPHFKAQECQTVNHTRNGSSNKMNERKYSISRPEVSPRDVYEKLDVQPKEIQISKLHHKPYRLVDHIHCTCMQKNYIRNHLLHLYSFQLFLRLSLKWYHNQARKKNSTLLSYSSKHTSKDSDFTSNCNKESIVHYT